MLNHFNIVRAVGLIFFGIGTFVFGITLPEIVEIVQKEDPFIDTYKWDDVFVPGIMALLGLGFLSAGLAGLLKARWFPRLATVVLVFAFICFNWIFVKYILPPTYRGGDILPSIGLFVMAYTLFFSFLFLMKNEYFKEALIQKDGKYREDNNILDAEDR